MEFGWKLWGAWAVLLALTTPALAQTGTDTFSLAGAYGEDGTICKRDTTFQGRTHVRCKGTADGSFKFAFRMRTGLANAPALKITPEFLNDEGLSGNVCGAWQCTVHTHNSDTSTLSLPTAVTVPTVNLASPTCQTAKGMCIGTQSGSLTPRDNQTGVACAAGTCSGRNVECKYLWYGSAGTGCSSETAGGIVFTAATVDQQ